MAAGQARAVGSLESGNLVVYGPLHKHNNTTPLHTESAPAKALNGPEPQIGNIFTSASPPLKYFLIVMSQPQVPSNPSSEVSIEEIGAEEELAICEKDTNAQEVSTLHPVWFVRNPVKFSLCMCFYFFARKCRQAE